MDVSKLTLSQQQQHAIMLLQHYHRFCNTNYLLSMFVSPPHNPNIESLSQLTISSLGSGSIGRNRADVNIKQRTTSEVADIDTVMDDNKELDTTPPQHKSNVFAGAYLSSHSTPDSAKYKRAWLKTKKIRSSVLSTGEFPDACIKALSIALNHK